MVNWGGRTDNPCQRHLLKPGNSVVADEAIARVLDILRPKEGDSFSEGEFAATWQELLKAVAAAFPNVSIPNLVALSLPLTARGLRQENLLINRLVVELNPRSREGWCFLGHSYREVGDLEAAAVCYQRAYDLAARVIAERELDPAHPERGDAADYLRHLAETESCLQRNAEAFLHAVQALNIVKSMSMALKQGNPAQEGGIYEALYRVCIGMNQKELAEHYRLLALKVREAERCRL